MVELRAVESTFPLYGTMTLQDKSYRTICCDHGVLVRPELLAQLNLRLVTICSSARSASRSGA